MRKTHENCIAHIAHIAHISPYFSSSAFIDDGNGTRITLQKYHPLVEDKISISFENGFDFYRWHHYCFVFQSFPNLRYPGGRLNLTTKAYVDGVFIREGV